jgi:hypothetical protein
LDFTAGASSTTLVIQNSAGFDMQNVEVYVVSTSGDMNCTDGDLDGTLTDGEQDMFYCLPPGGATLPSGKYKGALMINYTNAQTSLNHSKAGEVIMKIE